MKRKVCFLSSDGYKVHILFQSHCGRLILLLLLLLLFWLEWESENAIGFCCGCGCGYESESECGSGSGIWSATRRTAGDEQAMRANGCGHGGQEMANGPCAWVLDNSIKK